MPKDRASPYSGNPKSTDLSRTRNLVVQNGDQKEWEEARCPICMEHPHNAILLICSSHDKGCRPFMCNTSCRHSNCFDQFQKSFVAQSSGHLTGGVSPSHTVNEMGSGEWQQGRSEEAVQRGMTHYCERQRPKLLCPLCRGDIKGSIVVEPARQLMNSKPRSCSLEDCNFSGTYSELRRHARLEHPSVRPSDADLRRQRDWMNLEREETYQDLRSMLNLDYEDDLDEDNIFNEDDYWMWMENGMDVDGIFSAAAIWDSYDEWFENLMLMNYECELPFSFLGDQLEPSTPNPFSEIGGFGGSRSGQSYYSRSIRNSTTTYSTDSGHFRTGYEETHTARGRNNDSQPWSHVQGSQLRRPSDRTTYSRGTRPARGRDNGPQSWRPVQSSPSDRTSSSSMETRPVRGRDNGSQSWRPVRGSQRRGPSDRTTYSRGTRPARGRGNGSQSWRPVQSAPSDRRTSSMESRPATGRDNGSQTWRPVQSSPSDRTASSMESRPATGRDNGSQSWRQVHGSQHRGPSDGRWHRTNNRS